MHTGGDAGWLPCILGVMLGGLHGGDVMLVNPNLTNLETYEAVFVGTQPLNNLFINSFYNRKQIRHKGGQKSYDYSVDTSLAVLGALAHCLERPTAWNGQPPGTPAKSKMAARGPPKSDLEKDLNPSVSNN